jgi:hypothetical protein
MGTIIIEKMQLAKEAKLVSISDICVVLVHGPEESIIASLVTCIKPIANMSAHNIFSGT